MHYKELKSCIVCGSNKLDTVIDLGLQPLANNLKSCPTEQDEKYPLKVNECLDCTHMQLSIAVDPKLMFSNYLYQTGVSETHKEFFKEFVQCCVGNTVLDIGCNDGSLLKCFTLDGWKILGVEPAKEICPIGIPFIHDFFPTQKPIGKKFDCITAFNVFAHNDNPLLFLNEMAKLLLPEGKIYILTTPARLDNFYHEHISYFTPESMLTLVRRAGLEMHSWKEVSMHGKSYLFEISKKPKEAEYDNFLKFIDKSRPVVGYGASANGTVFLNYVNFKPEYVVDDNKLKQGKFIPGVNVPVVSKEYLISDKRDLRIIILAYNLFSEISDKIKKLRPNNKDVFIHPLEGVKS